MWLYIYFIGPRQHVMCSSNVKLCFVVFSFNSGKFSAKFPENNTSLVIREFPAYDKNPIGHILEPWTMLHCTCLP